MGEEKCDPKENRLKEDRKGRKQTKTELYRQVCVPFLPLQFKSTRTKLGITTYRYSVFLSPQSRHTSGIPPNSQKGLPLAKLAAGAHLA